MSYEEDKQHPFFARAYSLIAANAEARGGAQHRHELVQGLAGRVLEVGPGTGLNFKHYRSPVTQVEAIEPEPRLRKIAKAATSQAEVPINVAPGCAERLPFKDQSFDAAVTSLVLCSVTDQTQSLSELHRVIRPGGELRFYEHVRASGQYLSALQRAIRPIWFRCGGGCDLYRDTVAEIKAAGFTIQHYRRFVFLPSFIYIPVGPHILGVAVRDSPVAHSSTN